MLNRSADVRNSIIADYDMAKAPPGEAGGRTSRKSWTSVISDIRIIELVGTLNFAAIDYVTRRLSGEPRAAAS